MHLAAGLISALLGAATPAAPAARLNLDAVVERVQHRYDGAADFRARFTQTLTSAAMGRKTNSSGTVLFKKPGRMRWDYEKPERSTYVSDGNLLWLYEPEDRQAFKQALKASQLPAALAFLTGKGKLAAEFDVTAAGKTPYGAPGDYLLSLSPKVAEPQVKTILFVVDPQSFTCARASSPTARGTSTISPSPTSAWAPTCPTPSSTSPPPPARASSTPPSSASEGEARDEGANRSDAGAPAQKRKNSAPPVVPPPTPTMGTTLSAVVLAGFSPLGVLGPRMSGSAQMPAPMAATAATT